MSDIAAGARIKDLRAARAGEAALGMAARVYANDSLRARLVLARFPDGRWRLCRLDETMALPHRIALRAAPASDPDAPVEAEATPRLLALDARDTAALADDGPLARRLARDLAGIDDPAWVRVADSAAAYFGVRRIGRLDDARLDEARVLARDGQIRLDGPLAETAALMDAFPELAARAAADSRWREEVVLAKAEIGFRMEALLRALPEPDGESALLAQMRLARESVAAWPEHKRRTMRAAARSGQPA